MELVAAKKYKKTDVGMIPSDWNCIQIGDEIDLLTGFPFPSSGYSKEGVKLLRGSNIKRGVTDWSTEITQYWPKISTELKPYLLESGDIVISMDGSLVGRSFARLTNNDLPSVLLQRVARVRSKKIDQSFLKELICSDFFTKHCDSVKTSSAIPHISPGDIRTYKIPLPPTLAEQTLIATALSDADALISSLEQLIAKKKLIKQGAMQQLLKPKKGWEVKKLGEVANIVRGASPRPIEDPKWFDKDSTIGWVRISDVTKSNKHLTETVQKLSEEGIKSSRYVANDNLIMSICATVGRPMLTKINVCIHDGFVVFKDLKIQKDYLYYFLTFIEKDWAKQGQTGSQMNLNTTLINNTEVPFPTNISEQDRIATIFSDIDTEITALETKLDKYRKIKQGMMQNLLTGKIRLV
jgi:type I restriction enzyme S subunit